jgi:hypothetical protein
VSAVRATAAVVALGAAAIVAAATIDDFHIKKHKGIYYFEADIHLAATRESIYAVITDFDDNAYSRISGQYKESRYLEPAADGTPIVYTRMEGCAGKRCMSFERTERLETDAPRWIKSTALPEASDFKHATSEFILEPAGDGTEMIYKLEVEPDFFVPPLIGPWLLKRTVSKGALRAVERIEGLARELDGRPPVEPPPVTPSK